MATHLKASGEALEVQPAKGKKFSLAELQAFVDGYIELVRLGPNQLMFVNEEGRLRGLPYNVLASQKAQQIIVGDVLICTRREGGG